MKRVYFVRHGVTGGNKANAYQKSDIPLSDEGRAQAGFLAERLTKIPFDVLIASTMARAQETAETIALKTGHSVVSEHLFHEILRPSAVRGKVQSDPEAAEIMKVVKSYWNTEGKRHSDEENFYDLKDRALKALAYLVAREEETMVVVTHGTILNMLLAVMIKGGALDPDSFREIDKFFYMQNTGITWVEYDSKRPGQWHLITWNDHVHLG